MEHLRLCPPKRQEPLDLDILIDIIYISTISSNISLSMHKQIAEKSRQHHKR